MAFFPPSPGYALVTTSWGVTMWADPTKTVGQSISASGIYDLSVSEVLARLVQPDQTVIDVGANVGYMTLLAALVAGAGGRVLSFEPHPELFAILTKNILTVQERFQMARTELHNSAVGDSSGSAELWVPQNFAVNNDGTSQIVEHVDGKTPTISVNMETLDTCLGNDSAAVAKIDVEGFELQVLRGAVRSFESRRIRHIIFEDHAVEKSKVVRMLKDLGFCIFSIGWSMRGPVLAPVERGSLAKGREPPNFLASLEPDQAQALCRPRGWSVLKKFIKPCARPI
jgi:FkbM family methyltransferase